MTIVGIRDFKAHLSAYVREARAGHPIVVTDHGEVVAELRAPGASSRAVSPAELRYREAVATGALRPPGNPADRSWLVGSGAGLPAGTAAVLIDAERGDG